MMRKLFKKVAIITVAAIIGALTIMRSTVASAFNHSETQDYDIEGISVDLDAEGIEGGLDPQVNKELAAAFDKMTIYNDDEIVRLTVKVKDFKYFGDDSYISKITAEKHIYEGENYRNGGEVNYNVVEKDENGHPTTFEISYKAKSEWIVSGLFDMEITSGVEKVGFKNVEIISPDPLLHERGDLVGPGEAEENNAMTEDNKKVASNTSDKKTEETAKKAEAPTQTPTQTPTAKPVVNQSKDKTPKTADENSTAVMILLIVGSVSIVSLAGIYVYKRRKNNM